VFVSHLHGDHFGGLPFLILDGQFSGRTEPLTVAGPPGTADRLARLSLSGAHRPRTGVHAGAAGVYGL
jgi:ribonuclease BN (tRNA processing enzyme)